ncbi:MAG: hypothetical protein IKG87_10560 [Clostridia bacterium]|nr:hypothetical protein [Clostridia bacterium]MBR4577741.1 hypothetical protein [Clostridia bacterium]
MKRWMSLLVALLLAWTVGCAAQAEDAAEEEAMNRFCSVWVGAGNRIEIYAPAPTWLAVVYSANGTDTWEYECVYDAEQNALVSDGSAGNIKYAVTRDDEGSETGRTAVYENGEAVFSVNAEGKLVWDDRREGAGEGILFDKIGLFEGRWVCDDHTAAEICWDEEETEDGERFSGYKVEVQILEGEELFCWYYACAYDPADNTLKGIGTKEYQKEEGTPIETIYDDGTVVFSFDEEGYLIWNDEVENAGAGMRFGGTNG